ncbi:MAG TPA: hypothetical protein VK599_13320 [Streptosporangiaceae bacterium]|jgi:hypothetical protein|nr:hypothetical protein [Streptosporangiaceae bacterium]
MSRAEVLDMAASRSHVITLPDGDREQILGDVADFPNGHPDVKDRAGIPMLYITRCTRFRRE